MDQPITLEPIEHDWNWWTLFLQREYYASADEKGTWKRAVRGVLRQTTPSPTAQILDLGSGSGEMVMGLAEKGFKTTGLELSPGLVEECRRLSGERGVDAEFVVGDMFTKTFEASFDLVLLINTSFGYGTDEENRSLPARIHSMLNAGGVFYLDTLVSDRAESFGTWSDELAGGILTVENEWDSTTNTMMSQPYWIDSADGSIHVAPSPELVRLYSIADIETMLREAGFRTRRLPKGSGRTSRNESGPNSAATFLSTRA